MHVDLSRFTSIGEKKLLYYSFQTIQRLQTVSAWAFSPKFQDKIHLRKIHAFTCLLLHILNCFFCFCSVIFFFMWEILVKVPKLFQITSHITFCVDNLDIFSPLLFLKCFEFEILGQHFFSVKLMALVLFHFYFHSRNML